MNKKLTYSLCAAALLLTGCDYNEDNFPGYDSNVIPDNVTNIVYTLTDADYETIGGNVGTNKYFSANDMPDTYLPAWLAETYFTADAGSSANLTYRFKTIYPHYQDIPYDVLTEDDYTVIYGEGYNNANFLNASNVGRMYRILNAKYPEPKTDDLVMVEYQYSEDGVPSRGETIASWNFEDLEEGDVDAIDGWYVNNSGEAWAVREYSNNKYVQFSANGAEGAAEGWLITPAISISSTGLNLAFDVCVGYWNADCLSVLVSTDFAGNPATATWTDVTSQFNLPQEPASGYGTMASAGIMPLDDYAGQPLYVAFHYVGNGSSDNRRTTTYQIDNVMVANEIAAPVETEMRFALYEYTGNGWYEFENSNHAICLSMADYEEMGAPGDHYNFDDDTPSQVYLPQYLAKHGGYALDGDTCTVIFRRYDGANSVDNEQYIYSDSLGRWTYCDLVREETRPYRLNGSAWTYDPSVTITLEVGRNIAESATFYQAIVDWVADNYPEYVTSYGNNEYYFGSSAYQNNFDFRINAWQGQGTYPDMTGEQISALMWERLPEAFPHALEALYPNAAPVEGMDVTYTINFGIYDGSTVTYTIQYKVVGQGQFEYVENSLQRIS